MGSGEDFNALRFELDGPVIVGCNRQQIQILVHGDDESGCRSGHMDADPTLARIVDEFPEAAGLKPG